MAVGLDHPPIGVNVDYDYSALGEVWDGSTWSEESPGVRQTRDGFLQAVSCPSRSDCIAVGQGVASALALGWNGSRWKVQPAPVASSGMSILNGVSCTSATSCVAVGYVASDPSVLPQALAERWNGRRWSTIPTPNTAPGESVILNAVSCTRGACTAVGGSGSQQLVERWDGHRWSIQPTPDGTPDATLNGVSCVSLTDCVAVGSVTNAHQSIAERWNGSGWSIERTPTSAAGSLLWAVSCVSAADCVAVGQRGYTPLIERWNGTRWSIQ